MNDPVREFLKGAITRAGGIVDDTAGGLEALLPQSEAERLSVPEEFSIHLSSAAAPSGDGALDGRIGSSFLEQLVSERLKRAAIAAVALPAGLSSQLPDDLPVLLNAVRTGGAERRRTIGRFLAAELRVTLHGEDVRSRLVPLVIRLDDGARTEPFRVGGAYPMKAAPLDEPERRAVQAALQSWLWIEGQKVHAGALDTVRRRASRDLERLAEYYTALETEMTKAVKRARSPEERSRRRAKLAALPADLAARREQLRVRIRPRLAARLVAATLVECDVERFELPVRRRRLDGRLTLGCRTADGVVEGPACASCGVATVRLYLCDEQLHVLCRACGQAGKLDAARCRACRGWRPEPPALSIEDPTARLCLDGELASRVAGGSSE